MSELTQTDGRIEDVTCDDVQNALDTLWEEPNGNRIDFGCGLAVRLYERLTGEKFIAPYPSLSDVELRDLAYDELLLEDNLEAAHA